jgi:transposase
VARTGVLSDEAWARIEPLLPSSAGRRGGRWRNHRQVIEGIAWRYRTGAPWRDVPEEFGPFQTLWQRHDEWSRDGTWERLVTAVQADADAAGELDWLVSVDSTVVRAHQHAAGARRAADTLPALAAAADPPVEAADPPDAATAPTLEAAVRAVADTGGCIE